MDTVTKLLCEALCDELANQQTNYLKLVLQQLWVLFYFGLTLRAYCLYME